MDEDFLDYGLSKEFKRFSKKVERQEARETASHFDLVWKAGSGMKPVACTCCAGSGEEECRFCSGTGFFTVRLYIVFALMRLESEAGKVQFNSRFSGCPFESRSPLVPLFGPLYVFSLQVGDALVNSLSGPHQPNQGCPACKGRGFNPCKHCKGSKKVAGWLDGGCPL